MNTESNPIAWVNRELSGLRGNSPMDRKFGSELRQLHSHLQAGKAAREVVDQLAPLCPCSSDPDGDGPQQECPLHGDGLSFVALCQWRDVVVAEVSALRETPGLLVGGQELSGWRRLCKLLDDGPWGGS